MVHCVRVDMRPAHVRHLALGRASCRLPNSVRRHRRKCHHSTQLPVNAITTPKRKRADSGVDARLCVNRASDEGRDPGQLPGGPAIGPVVKTSGRLGHHSSPSSVSGPTR